MRSRYKAIVNDVPHFISSSTVNWIPLFNRNDVREILLEALRYRVENNIIKLHAYIIMPNHFHAILTTANITKTIKEFKSYTARLIVDLLKLENQTELLRKFEYFKKKYKTDSTYQIWQEGYHPEMIISMDMFNQKAMYIHNNPVKANLVKKAEDWPYSSASNYILGTGVLPIDVLQ